MWTQVGSFVWLVGFSGQSCIESLYVQGRTRTAAARAAAIGGRRGQRTRTPSQQHACRPLIQHREAGRKAARQGVLWLSGRSNVMHWHGTDRHCPAPEGALRLCHPCGFAGDDATASQPSQKEATLFTSLYKRLFSSDAPKRGEQGICMLRATAFFLCRSVH